MRILLVLLLCLPLSMTVGCSMPRSRTVDRVRAEEMVRRGILLMRHGENDKAYAAFEVAFDTYPLASALDGKGCVALMQGRLGEAETYFHMAADQDPNYLIWMANLALLRELQGDNESALDLYRSYLKKKSFDPKKRSNYAAFLYDKGSILEVEEDALIELRKSLVIGGGALASHNVSIAEQSK